MNNMKAQFLKIAKCKTEKEFYKKYPTEAAFFKAHPEARSIKKAQIGTYIGGDVEATPKLTNYQDVYDQLDRQLTGSTEEERLDRAAKQAQIAAASKISSSVDSLGAGNINSSIDEDDEEGSSGGGLMDKIGSLFGGAKYGKHIPKAQVGTSSPGIQTTGYAFGQQSPWGLQTGLPSGVSSGQPQVGTLVGGTQISASQAANQPVFSNAMVNQAEKSPFDIAKTIPFIGPVAGAIQAFGAESDIKDQAQQAMKLSGLALDLSRMKPEQKQRRYVQPKDNIIQPGQNFLPGGVGTNPLARNGMRLQGGGEIQNTYAPNYLYDDLGYEPLGDSNVKQYQLGGAVAANIAGNFIGSQFNNNAGYQAGSALGGFSDLILPGSSAIVSPILGTIGGAIDQAFGDAGKISKFQAKAKRNTEGAAMNNMGQSIQSANNAYVKNGGWVSHDWQPQVISSFGGLNEQEVYDYAHDGMESLRSGGHIRGEYTPISNRGMEQYAMGGEVKTTWGGHAETISHNPYMPGTGETIMFRGKSHDESDGNGHTGIGVKYGKGEHDSYTDYAEFGSQEADATVEVERGEPAVELQDANGEKNLTVYGNLKIPNQYINLLGDPKAKGKKFKNYVNDLSKIEDKQSKIIETSIDKLNALNPQTQFDKLKLTSLQANIQGANMKLKDIADKKINAAHLQNAINDTAEENGLVADDLAKGKVKFDKEALQEYAEYGKTIKKAASGTTTDDGKKISKAERNRLLKSGEYKVDPSDPNKIYRVKSKSGTSDEKKTATALGYIPKGQSVDPNTGLSTKITSKQFEDFKEKNKWYDWSKFDPKDPNAVNDAANKFNERAKELGSDARILPDKNGKVTIIGEQFISGNLDASKKDTPGSSKSDYLEVEDEDKVYDVNAKKRNRWVDLAGQLLPFFMPTDQEPFDQSQIYPEISSIVNNQLEPVQAQGYQPDLGTPQDISLQDQLNANQADFNSIQRLYANNPFALAQFAAQKYAANEKVLGDQFRLNQAERAGVYDRNRDILNQAKLTNLGIYDKQYERQAQAKSNTKAIAQAALNSIADKYAKHKLENRTLGVYENLYNYRYSPSGRIINMNAPWQANLPIIYDKGNKVANMRDVYDQSGNFLRWERIEETEPTVIPIPDDATTPIVEQKKYGGSKKAKNGSIVSAYKNL